MPQSLLSRPLACLGLAVTAWLAGCQSAPVTEDVPPPRIDQLGSTGAVLDWAGTYQAILPCQGCPGIAMSVQLRDDETALVRERRLGGDSPATPAETYQGPFRFDPPGSSLVTLGKSAGNTAYRFLVSDGWIELRDRNTGSALTASPIYRLRKTSLTP